MQLLHTGAFLELTRGENKLSLSITHRCLTPVQHCETVPLKACAVRVCACEQEDCMCVHSCLALIVLS